MKTNETKSNARKQSRVFRKKTFLYLVGVAWGVAFFGVGVGSAQAGGLGISLNLGCASINFSAGDAYPAPPVVVPAFPVPAPVVVAEPSPAPEPFFSRGPVPAPFRRPLPISVATRPPRARNAAPLVRGQAPNATLRTYSPVGSARTGNAPDGPRRFEPRR